MAARVMLEGKADRLICSGTDPLDRQRDGMAAADSMERVLLSLNVPQEKILKIGGRNTLEEIQAFDQWLTANNAGGLRKGIVTSAWHMPRALRLAETVGVQAAAIPADFFNDRFQQSPNLLVPGVENLTGVTMLLKEHWAGWFGR